MSKNLQILTMKTADPKKKDAFFISFEGGEGAGKTTLIHKVELSLKNHGFDVIKTREPGGSLLGEQIRKLLLDQKETPIVGMAELLLFLAARAQQIEEVIKPAIEEGKIILCDRFNDSTIVYQGAGRQLGIEKVEKLCHLVCGNVAPHLTLFLDVDPQIGLSRTTFATKENAKAGHKDRIEAEALEFHTRIRNAYLSIAQKYPERFFIIDANKPAKSVYDAAIRIIRSKIEG